MKKYIFIFLILSFVIGCENEENQLNPRVDFVVEGELNTFTATQFINQSENTDEYFWDFGDGVFSDQKDPIHLYEKVGEYKVTLSAIGNSKTVSSSKIIKIEPVETKPEFSFTPSLDTLSMYDKISFTNHSTYSYSYLWDFGDGVTSTDINPTHAYTNVGDYIVKLTAINDNSSQSTEKKINISDIRVLPYRVIDIDFENDGVIDLSFYPLNYQLTKKLSIINLNGYEIFADTTSIASQYTYSGEYKAWRTQTKVPKAFKYGDTIDASQLTDSRREIGITYTQDYYCKNCSDVLVTPWKNDEISYIGFKKTVNGVTKIGWIKLKVVSGYDFVTYLLKIPTETESLKIER